MRVTLPVQVTCEIDTATKAVALVLSVVGDGGQSIELYRIDRTAVISAADRRLLRATAQDANF